MKNENSNVDNEGNGKPGRGRKTRRVSAIEYLVLAVLLVAAVIGLVIVLGSEVSQTMTQSMRIMNSAVCGTQGVAVRGAIYEADREMYCAGSAAFDSATATAFAMSQPQEPETPGYEQYAEFRENGFLDAKANPLSTFSIDVDTASYTMARSSLVNMRRLPVRQSVRIEEFVNYFDWNYPEPTGAVPFSVSCELADCPWADGHQLLRVALQARRVADDQRPPNNLVFLIDISGSMSDRDKLPLLKQALGMLVDSMRPDDSVAIVVYASGVRVHLDPTPGTRRERIRDALDKLVASGATSGGEGLRLAYETARKNFRKGANNRILLATDGDFNVGSFNTDELVGFVEKQRNDGIFLSVLGFGRGNYQDARMKKVADNANGTYSFIDSALEAKKVLGKESGSFLTVAKDVKIQIDFNPSIVGSYRLLGYESRALRAEDFKDDRKDAGEMGAGHNVTAFYEIIPAGAADADAPDVDSPKYTRALAVESPELCTVKLRWKEPDSDAGQRFEIPVLPEGARLPDGPSEDFRFASAVAEVAQLLRDSANKGNSSWESAVARARKARGADEDGIRAEFVRLAETAMLLAAERDHKGGATDPAQDQGFRAGELVSGAE